MRKRAKEIAITGSMAYPAILRDQIDIPLSEEVS
jgi:hypothetical protein